MTENRSLEEWRAEFPILEKCTYLVNHSLGAMPNRVVDKLKGFTDHWAERGVRCWSEGWWSAPIDVGNLLGRIMNAPEGTVAMHQNVSVIQAIVGSALDFSGPRNKVVYTDQNFPTNMYVWEGFRRDGAEIVCVKSDDPRTAPTDKLLEAIDERTLIVPISHVCFKNSFMQDAEAICRRAREVGAMVLLDTYQSLGCVPVDVQALGVDMVCGGSVKWLVGGPGAGYLYVRPDVLETLEPRFTGWAAHAAPFAFEQGAQRYAEGSWRLLHGSPAVASLLQASAGYEIILEVGVERIRAASLKMTRDLRTDLERRGFEIFTVDDDARRGGTLTVALDANEDGPAFVAALEKRDILVDHRPEAGIRVSPHFYTRPDELARFAEVMEDLRHTGAWKEHLHAAGAY